MIDSYLYEGFKEQLEVSFLRNGDEADWAEIVNPDPNVADRIDGLVRRLTALMPLSRMSNPAESTLDLASVPNGPDRLTSLFCSESACGTSAKSCTALELYHR
jgi:hypothetical protein